MSDLLVADMDEIIEDTQKDKYLTFTLGNESYGVEIKFVTEIIGVQPITEVPEMPEYIKGIINLRGKIIPVMDVRLRFHKAFQEYNDRTCIVVIDVKDTSIGLIVDRVTEVLSIPDTEIVTPPEMSKGNREYIKGVGKVGQEVKLILDCDKLLNEQEAEEINHR
ncbi:chemotaxis protein CheW [Heliophilum fasciatum]|uniref:Chemotaxis protein CheW n=1 Tax=Heliophilum fasciatum TaxID=35700 RepID=A0A4R2RXE3_9FIRM|nr:chemotaxis protein CheW [Heliophilum fasciatum]MCW2278331.1 purine-binding chemotaxis protein CheW [Heliophilum fasciatum]TCP63795.1 purine-binding chemotaxis protein CheW [Heliophilum fasciatum]